MQITKRDGSKEEISFDKISLRIAYLIEGIESEGRFGDPLSIDSIEIAKNVCGQVADGITTSQLDEYAAEVAAYKVSEHPDYDTLAARIIISNNHKNNTNYIKFSDMMNLISTVNKTLSNSFMKALNKYKNVLDELVDKSHKLDYKYLTYFGFKTLERSYLTKVHVNDHIIYERPQHLLMRVALDLNRYDLNRVIECYGYFSNFLFTHATPTLYNAGTKNPQYSSCFVKGTQICTIGGIKNIEDVVIDDEVVTHTGNVRKVKQIHKNLLGDRKIYKLKCHMTPDIYVTENHRLMATTKLGKGFWVPVENLTTEYYVEIPKKLGGLDNYKFDLVDILDSIKMANNIKLEYEYDDKFIIPFSNFTHKNGLTNKKKDVITKRYKCNKISRYLTINETTAMALGAWYGDGCVLARSGVNKGINIVCHEQNQNLTKTLIKQIKDMIGIVPTIYTCRNLKYVTINSVVIGSVFEYLFGKEFANKKLHPSMFEWSEKLVKNFMIGLMNTDGCLSNSGQMTITLSNPNLCKQLYHLCRQIGVPISISKEKMRKGTTTECVTITLPLGWIQPKELTKYYSDNRLKCVTKNSTTSYLLYKNDKIYVKIKSIEETDRNDEYVYTFGVQTDHSYNVEGLVAENCFLLTMDDSVYGMYKCLEQCSQISKWAGGIGISVSKIRANGSIINSTKGESSGILTLLKVYNEFAKHINQGGRRKGAVAIYNEPWHADIFAFLALKMIGGNEQLRARELFYALYIPDLFMRRLDYALNNPQEKIMWSLMCPYDCPGLPDVYGLEFEQLYESYEAQGRYRTQIDITKLWDSILDSHLEASLPYMVYKDAVNNKSNQKNIGIIRCSNLCSEITEYSNPDEIAMCNLSSIVLHRYVKDDMTYDHITLANIAGVIVHNINNTINQNFYTCIETMKSNLRHRPMAIGVQGLAETFFKLRFPYESDNAMKLNREIFETILYGALRRSCELAKARTELLHQVCNHKSDNIIKMIREMSSKLMSIHFRLMEYNDKCHDNDTLAMILEHEDDINNQTKYLSYITEQFKDVIIEDNIIGGLIHINELQYLLTDTRMINTPNTIGAYSTFEGSPASQGILQFDMWENPILSGRWDWDALKQDIKQYGILNSLLTSCMPTASTAQIMGSTEAFEPITSNLYSRSVSSGDFPVVNKFLQHDLLKLGLWNVGLKNQIVEHRGLLDNIPTIPIEIKQLYKSAWDIKKNRYIDMSKERGWFIDQTQSLNLFIPNPDYKILTRCHMHAWRSGLKTGMYYLRRKAAVEPIQFSLEKKEKDHKHTLEPLENRLHDNLNKAVKGDNITEVFQGSCTGGSCGA